MGTARRRLSGGRSTSHRSALAIALLGALAVVGVLLVDRRPAVSANEPCGTPPFERTGNAASDVARLDAALRPRVEATKARLIASMSASDSERTRAAALWFQAAIGATAGNVDGCRPDLQDCDDLRRRVERSKPHRDALARLASRSRDPQVHAWAVRACTGAESTQACSFVSDAQWARIDPDNGAVWERIAASAHERGDPAALDEAMHRLGAATRHDVGWHVLAALLLEQLPAGERHSLAAWSVLVEAIDVDAGDITSGPQAALRYCDAKALVDPNRRETCSRVAAAMAERSTTVLTAMVGRGIAKRVGWPEERIRPLDDLRDAYPALLAAMPADPWSCEAVAQGVAQVRDTARLGEIEWLRQRAAATGSSIEQLAQRTRAERSRAAQTGSNAAASSASAARR